MAPHLVEIALPTDSLELQERCVNVPLAEPAGTPGPGLDLGPIPRRLAGYGPARLRHELAVTPGVDGLRSDTKTRGNLGRPDGNRLARGSASTRHEAIVAFNATNVKNGFQPILLERLTRKPLSQAPRPLLRRYTLRPAQTAPTTASTINGPE